ncbi:DUF2796 domain-containing protein [Shimia sp. NS0008-38b]|uniref:zinc uptake protein ZrgA n=1 Tax=Shimia sp. NS0008-38b TaxID=3127653 RepID=UPI003102749E
MKLKATLLCSSLICVALPLTAEEKRELQSHEHGHGALNIAVDDNVLLIELEVPGFDIVGFEHVAQTDADKAAVDAKLTQLKDPTALFALPKAAGCLVSSAAAELHGDEQHHDTHDEHDEAHDDHKDEHDHDDHDHEDHADHDDNETHSEFHAEYAFVCEDASKLTKIDLSYFNVFENAEELDVQVVTDDGAKKVEASRTETTIELN